MAVLAQCRQPWLVGGVSGVWECSAPDRLTDTFPRSSCFLPCTFPQRGLGFILVLVGVSLLCSADLPTAS